MAISAVSSATNTVQQQQQVALSRQQNEAVRPNEDRTRGMRQAQPQARASEQVQRQERPEKPERDEAMKPVVNAQGQKTGTIINTTA